MGEAGVPDYEVTTFNGIMAPAGTPAAIISTLNAALNAGLATPEMKETIARLGRSLASLRSDKRWYEDATRLLIDQLTRSDGAERELPLLWIELAIRLSRRKARTP